MSETRTIFTRFTIGLFVVGLLLLTVSWKGGLRALGSFKEGPTKVFESPENAAPDFAEGTWINSEPLTLKGLRGQVVLIEFWTFGCYNCRNTLPFVKAWHEKYSNKGLTIVGVHSPELDGEEKIDNLRRQVASLGIRYPVVTDNKYATWNAYKVQAWPTIFLIDKNGKIRWSHVGEGKYDEAEKQIQNLIKESDVMTEKIEKTPEQWKRELSPEQYHVLREAGTERAFTGAYWDNHEKGAYYCAACGLKLFSSDTKFDSGTGWPSFFQPVAEANVDKDIDTSLGVARIEVKCKRCGSHLGHVFDDGPRPTGLRYCMNSISLKFVKE